MPTSPSSTARSGATPPAAAKTQRNGPTWTARISLLAIPLLAVALSARRRETGPRVFTKEELAKYVDTSKGLKVAICGQVFDVTKGAEFYAKGAGYGFFAGRDASLAFATGNFKTNLTDNVGAPASPFLDLLDGVER
jgi:predicted heme/steroid binding protein